VREFIHTYEISVYDFIWLMDFIYTYKIEQWNLLQLLQVGEGGGWEGEMEEGTLTNV
jgi:hypothetical protein